MDRDFLLSQLSQLAASIVEVSKTLSSVSKSTYHRSVDVCDLLNARMSIVDSIISLNSMLSEFTAVESSARDILRDNSSSMLSPGIIVVTLRYLSRRIQPDLGIVLSYENEVVYISWLRPLTAYELLAHDTAISYSIHQLNINGTVFLQKEIHMLSKLEIGDRVLCRINKDLGIWKPGLVVNTNHDQSLAEVKIFTEDGSVYTEKLTLNISQIAPYPYDSDSQRKDGSTATEHFPTPKFSNDGRQYLGNSSTADEAPSFNYARLPPSYSYEEDSYTSISADITLAELSRFGTWEIHTKGVGSRVLRRMGYTR
jgi:hypothetical protein